jgi:hypothetical protein
MTLLDYYEQIALPGLALAQIDVARGVMDRGRQVEIGESVERVVADLADHVDAGEEKIGTEPAQVKSAPATDGPKAAAALCLAGRTPIDQAACSILVELLERRNIPTRVGNSAALSIQGASPPNAEGIHAICIFYLGRQSLAVVRYSVRRLRKRFPGIPIAVCLWGGADLAPMVEAAQADATVNSLSEAINFCVRTAIPAQPEEVASAPLLANQ